VVTAAQAKSFLKPLLAKNGDLALVGRLLVVRPVRHVLRAVLLDGRSSAERIVPAWLIYHLFGPYPIYFLSWGDEFWGRLWNTTDPDISEALCGEIEKTALPKLRAIKTLDDFLAAIPKTRGAHLLDIDPEAKSLMQLAMGELEAARQLCQAKICGRADPGPKEPDVTKAEAAGAKKLCVLLEKNDIAGIAATLHAWEAANVKALKIDHLWEPTPFPLEVKFGLASTS